MSRRAGYVKRTRHPKDRRGVLVSLTAAGRTVFEQAFAANLEGEKDLLTGLTKAEQRSLVSLLRKLLGALEPLEPKA
jgi:DNA-binding MarR family transcriptional regulator